MQFPNPTNGVSAILVASENSLLPGGGGVQVCTADYLSLLSQAGFKLHQVSFVPDRRFLTRVLRRLEGRPYLRIVPPSLTNDVISSIKKTGARYVFFNLIDFPNVASELRECLGDEIKLVHLSHGLDSTDIWIDQQVQRGAQLFGHPSCVERECFTDILGRDSWQTTLDEWAQTDAILFMRLCSSRLWVRQRAILG